MHKILLGLCVRDENKRIEVFNTVLVFQREAGINGIMERWCETMGHESLPNFSKIVG